MPKGIPVGTLAIGEAGAANAAFLAAQILALHDTNLSSTLKKKRLDDQAAGRPLPPPGRHLYHEAQRLVAFLGVRERLGSLLDRLRA